MNHFTYIFNAFTYYVASNTFIIISLKGNSPGSDHHNGGDLSATDHQYHHWLHRRPAAASKGCPL